MYTHICEEDGNGFPQDGDTVIVRDEGGDEIAILGETSPIMTAQGHANYVYCTVHAASAEEEDAISEEEYDELHVVRPIDDDEDEDA